MCGSLVRVTDDHTHCHFMAPSAMLKVEICERISRDYISHDGGHIQPAMNFTVIQIPRLTRYVCACVCVLPRETWGES